MKILKGRDYYDSVLEYGRDEGLIFLRNDKTVSHKECPLVPLYPWTIVSESKKYRYDQDHIITRDVEYKIQSVSVYVAGKHYGGVSAVNVKSFSKITFWHYDTFCNWLSKFNRQVQNPENNYRYSFALKPEKIIFPNLQSWMTPQEASKEELDWIINNKVVIAIHKDNSNIFNRDQYGAYGDWHLNCASKEYNLKSLEFAKIVDPYTMLQELSMFIGGVLPRDANPMIEITDDKIKLAKHGFDKWTFRKQKE